MFIWSRPKYILWLGHTEVWDAIPEDTPSPLPHTLLPPGRKKTHSPYPFLWPGFLRSAAPTKCSSFNCLPPSQDKRLRSMYAMGKFWWCICGEKQEAAEHDGEVHQPDLGSQHVFSWLWFSPFHRQSVLHSSHTHHSQRNCSKAHRCF